MTLSLACNYVDGVFGHLQIVNTATDQELEAGAKGNGYIDFRENISNHSSKTNYAPNASNADTDRYHIVSINTGDRDSSSIWSLLVTIHFSFCDSEQAIGFDYDVWTLNSNSYVYTLLWMVGVDLSPYYEAVKPNDVWFLPASGTNLLTDTWTSSPELLSMNLTATADNDILRTGDGDDTLFGAAGNDSLSGGDGNDVISGGDGAYFLTGQVGADSLFGGGADSFAMNGGQNLMAAGGAGADVFDVHAADPESYGQCGIAVVRIDGLTSETPDPFANGVIRSASRALFVCSARTTRTFHSQSRRFRPMPGPALPGAILNRSKRIGPPMNPSSHVSWSAAVLTASASLRTAA